MLLSLGGCAGVPAAVVWGTVGAGLGATGAALRFDDDVLRAVEDKKAGVPQTVPATR